MGGYGREDASGWAKGHEANGECHECNSHQFSPRPLVPHQTLFVLYISPFIFRIWHKSLKKEIKENRVCVCVCVREREREIAA